MTEGEIERFSKESQEKSAERAGYFYHQIIKKDAQIERLVSALRTYASMEGGLELLAKRVLEEYERSRK